MSTSTARKRVNPIRHILLFDPERFDNSRVDVIGCGAVGSRIAMEMAKLGVRNLHLWDGDCVESHNIANQLFTLTDIGRPKVEALAEAILAATGLESTAHHQRIESPVTLGSVVFLAVDTMAARRAIFKDCLHLKFTTQVVIDVRMGVEELRVYGFNPRSRAEVLAWEATLTNDAQTVESACGARTTVGATAGITACIAVHRFLQYYRRDVVRDPAFLQPPHFEQVMMLRPLITITRGV
ncbi:ThiF family adenylyltransferase [Candidatus Kaiserbacteria bacterium]|nr:ThiF family adenylyltransferase [Candidatus Kaiserbacteria bacterium]